MCLRCEKGDKNMTTQNWKAVRDIQQKRITRVYTTMKNVNPTTKGKEKGQDGVVPQSPLL